MSIQLQDLELLDAVRDYTLRHRHPHVAGFKAAIRDWGDDWRAVEARQLPVAGLLEDAVDRCDNGRRELLQCFLRHGDRLRWEQSYRRQDGQVPGAMLDNYGFAEVIGLRGPFVSDRIRAGIAIWGPHIDYPLHRHEAVEVYDLLCGSACFRFGDSPGEMRYGNDVVLVDSNRRHGFSTGDESLVVFYLWQAGDLRQTSRFD